VIVNSPDASMTNCSATKILDDEDKSLYGIWYSRPNCISSPRNIHRLEYVEDFEGLNIKRNELIHWL
jgi:hypothetical protein